MLRPTLDQECAFSYAEYQMLLSVNCAVTWKKCELLTTDTKWEYLQLVRKYIVSKAKCQEHNFGQHLMNSRSNSVWRQSAQVDRGGAKGNGQEDKKVPNDA